MNGSKSNVELINDGNPSSLFHVQTLVYIVLINTKASTSSRVNAIKNEIMPHGWLGDVEFENLLMHDYLTSLHLDMLLDFGYLQSAGSVHHSTSAAE